MLMPLLPENLLPASAIAYVSCFILTMFFLRNETKLLDRIMISSAAMVSGVWLYELAYHYMWGFSGLLTDLSAPRINNGGNVPFPIYFAIFLICMPLLVRRYISLNKPFIIVSATSALLFGVWYAIGFPQFWCVCSYEPIWGVWLNRASVEPLGYVMNSLTKLLAVVPAFLFYRQRS